MLPAFMTHTPMAPPGLCPNFVCLKHQNFQHSSDSACNRRHIHVNRAVRGGIGWEVTGIFTQKKNKKTQRAKQVAGCFITPVLLRLRRVTCETPVAYTHAVRHSPMTDKKHYDTGRHEGHSMPGDSVVLQL